MPPLCPFEGLRCACAKTQAVETCVITQPDANSEHFSRGDSDAIVLMPGGALAIGDLDVLEDALAKFG